MLIAFCTALKTNCLPKNVARIYQVKQERKRRQVQEFMLYLVRIIK